MRRAQGAGSRAMQSAVRADALSSLELIGEVLNPDAPRASSGDPMGARARAVDWPLVVVLASRHLVTPALHTRFGDVGLMAYLDDELLQYFRTITELNRARNRRIRIQLEHLVSALCAFGIEPVLLKGAAHLLLGLYRDDADRAIGDIDILVPQQQCEETLGVLHELGYAPHVGQLEHAHLHHYPPLARPDSEAWVELHKVASPCQRALPSGELISRARKIRIGHGSAAVPCPEDLVVHNVVHSQLHNRGFWSVEFALRDAYDLVLLTRHFADELDWSRLAARIEDDVGKHRAGFYVRLSHCLFGQNPPPLAWPLGARLADWRWRLHAQGRMLWLQRTTRVMAYELGLVSEIIHNPAWRRRPIRRLLDPRWYRQHLGRVRAATEG